MKLEGQTKLAQNVYDEVKKEFTMNGYNTKDIITLKEILEVLKIHPEWLWYYPIPSVTGLFNLYGTNRLSKPYLNLGIEHPCFKGQNLLFEFHLELEEKGVSFHTNNEYLKNKIFELISKLYQERFYEPQCRDEIKILEPISFRKEYFKEEIKKELIKIKYMSSKKILDVISNKEYEMLKFLPFIEYIKKLEQENFVLLNDKEECGWRELIFQNDIEFLQILIYTDLEKEWIIFYKFKEEYYKYVQTEFHLYKEKCVKFQQRKYNRVIKFAGYSLEGAYAKLITSAFAYHDNKYIINSGWRHKRKIKKEDLNKIDTYCMNLQDLIKRAENKKLTFYESIDEQGGYVQKLKLTYDE